mgnify:CR=1 FL=1
MDWNVDFQQIVNRVWSLITLYGLRLLAAIAVYILGRLAAKLATNILERTLERRKVDPTLASFVTSLTSIGLTVFVIIAALSQLGIQTTSIVAVVGAAGLAVGLALQGSLSNFAAGFLMIMFRPFHVGDYIEGAGTIGTVESIHIFTTQIVTPDNKVIIVPNASLTSDNIVNWSRKKRRRVDMVFGISYGDDIDKARSVLEAVLAEDERVLKEPAPMILVGELGDNSVHLLCRPWVQTADYWMFFWETVETVKKRFDQAGITIPFPQRDVHLDREAA